MPDPNSHAAAPQEVQETLTDVFREVFDDDELVPYPAMTAKDVDGWDSLTHVRLLLTIERRFGVAITASEAARLQSVGELTSLLRAKLASGGRAQ